MTVGVFCCYVTEEGSPGDNGVFCCYVTKEGSPGDDGVVFVVMLLKRVVQVMAWCFSHFTVSL